MVPTAPCHANSLRPAGLPAELRERVSKDALEVLRHQVVLEYGALNAETVLKVCAWGLCVRGGREGDRRAAKYLNWKRSACGGRGYAHVTLPYWVVRLWSCC